MHVANAGSRYYDHLEITNPTGQFGKPDNQDSLQPFVGSESSSDDDGIVKQSDSNVKSLFSRTTAPQQTPAELFNSGKPMGELLNLFDRNQNGADVRRKIARVMQEFNCFKKAIYLSLSIYVKAIFKPNFFSNFPV